MLFCGRTMKSWLVLRTRRCNSRTSLRHLLLHEAHFLGLVARAPGLRRGDAVCGHAVLQQGDEDLVGVANPAVQLASQASNNQASAFTARCSSAISLLSASTCRVSAGKESEARARGRETSGSSGGSAGSG